MAFFEQVGKRISDVGEGVVHQTKRLTDIAHLNSAISEKENQIFQLYTAIGRCYYEKHRDDETAEEIEKLREIQKLREEIEQQKEEVKKLKGVVKCPNCGTDVHCDAVFCNMCGTKLVQTEKSIEVDVPKENACPNCHMPIEEGNLFCRHCGTKL